MLKQLKNNNRGIVFVTVLITVIVMMVLTMSVIGMNVSQSLSSENEIKRLKAEMLAMGAFSYLYANLISNSSSNFNYRNIVLDNITYNIIANSITTGTGPYGTNTIQFIVDF